MSKPFIESYIAAVEYFGLNTEKDATFEGDVVINGKHLNPTGDNLSNTLTNNFLPYIPPTLGTGSGQKYRMPTAAEIRGIINGLYLIAREAGREVDDIDLADATTLLSPHGFTISKGYDSESKRAYVLVQAENTYPSSSNYRAWGWYILDLSQPISLIVSAPHPQTDGNSEFIALRYAQKVPGAMCVLSSVNRKAKDYMVTEISTDHTGGTYTLNILGLGTTAGIAPNASVATIQSAVEAVVGGGKALVTGDPADTSLHAFINLSGALYNSSNPTNTITVASNNLTGGTYLTLDHDADVAHNYNSVFNKVIEAFARFGYANLQIHGFSDTSDGVPRCFSGILSRGSSNDTKLIEAIRTALEADGFDIAVRDTYDTQGLYFTGFPTGGTFTLTCDSQTTGSISYSINQSTLASNIQVALESLSSIGSGNVVVTVSQNNNGSVPAFVITFKGGLYHTGKEVTVADNSLTGGVVPAPVVLTANGTALTAQSNTQGDIAEAQGTVFMHLELSATVRESAALSQKVVDALANTNLPQLSAAAMPVLAESGHDVSQAPLVNGSGATIGTTNVAARSDHRHPATTNTPTTGDIIYRDTNSWQAGTPDVAGAVAKTGDQTISGVKVFTTDSSGNGPQIYRSSSTAGQKAILQFRVSATPNATSSMASIQAIRTDTHAAQDTAITFYNRRNGGGESEGMRLTDEGGLEIKNATIVPASNPSGGGVLYVEDGALKYRGSSGTVTTIANA